MRPGDVLAKRYRLDRMLGRGGMGTVWAATHVLTAKRVALKLLRAGDDETARRRVLREARAACAVQHPNVVPVHDVIEASDGAPVLVMDLLDGESLRQRLDREQTVAPDEALRIGRAVLDALVAAHDAGIVHRDLKPDNLYLARDGRVLVLDFGVAKLLARDGAIAASGTLTATDAMVGTPYYMAPEQAFGEDVDGRADLWALGVVLYECLAGEPPTRAPNLGQVLRRLTTGDLVPLARRAAEISPSIAGFVDGLVAIDRARRPDSARVARDLLDAAAARARAGDDLPSETSPASASPGTGAGASRDQSSEAVLDGRRRGPSTGAQTTVVTVSHSIAERLDRRSRSWIPYGGAVIVATGLVVLISTALSSSGWRAASGRVAAPEPSLVAPTPATVSSVASTPTPSQAAESALPSIPSATSAPRTSSRHVASAAPTATATATGTADAQGTKLLTKVPF